MGACCFINSTRGEKVEYQGDSVLIDIDDYIDNKVIPIYKKTINRGERFLVFMGGGGSGKSYFVSQLITIRTFEADEAMKTLIIRNVKEDNRISTFVEIKEKISDLGLDDFFTINKSTMDITCKRNGNQIIFRGLDDIERVKSISGITQIWIEEASEISEDAFRQLNIRLRNHRETYENQILITFNPISQNHWLKKKFFDFVDPEDKAKTYSLKTTYKDNPYLPQENVDELEALKKTSPYYYQVYCLGEWGEVGESVFSREMIGKRKDEIFRMHPKTGYFKFMYVGEQIVNESIQWVDSPNGPITLFSDPDDAMPYVLGADTAGIGIDNFASLVINNYNGDIVAQYYEPGKDETYFTHQLYCLGMWYNEGMINPETNYSTYPVMELARLQYPTLYKREIIGTNDGSRTENRYGFVTTKTSRNSILSLVDDYTKTKIDTIPSYELLDEMSNFILVETKSRARKGAMRQEAAKGAHDDLIMALGITLFTRDQWDKHPRPERRPIWKRDEFDPLGFSEPEEDFSLW